MSELDTLPPMKRFNLLFRLAVGILIAAIIVEFSIPLKFGTEVLNSPAMIGIHFCAGLCIFLSLMATVVYLKEKREANYPNGTITRTKVQLSKKQEIAVSIVIICLAMGLPLFILQIAKSSDSPSFMTWLVNMIMGSSIIIAISIGIVLSILKKKNNRKIE